MTHLRFLVCSVLLVVSVSADTTYSCYDNYTSCVIDMRNLLLDTERFWFGSSYESSCPGGSSPVCNNADTSRKSILSRLLGLNDVADASVLTQDIQTISLANITFNAPAGNYTGCGQEYQVPALSGYQVDPLGITRVSSWSLSFTPKVTWKPKTQDTYHILVIWDVGNHYLHGLYINCVNGSLEGGVAVRPYFGPLNANMRPNTYIFAVYEQSNLIDINEAIQFLEGLVYVEPAKFIANFTSSNNSKPIHAGVMTVVSDAYSVQKISDRFYVANNCPYLISQQDTFHKVINASGLSVPWSDNAGSSSLISNTTYLTSLTTSIDVRYTTDDYSIESCCSTYSLTRGTIVVNPLSDATVRPGNVRVTPNVQLTPRDIRSDTGIAGETYTLFLLDVAAAMAPGATNPVYVTHWLVTNIRNAEINTGDEVARYFGPNPFTPNEHRPYMFLLLRQPVEKLNNTIFSTLCPNGTMRCRTPLKPVLDAWNLTDIVGLTWFLAEQDAFARYRLYSVLNAVGKDKACAGQPGYAEPCPIPCSLDTKGGNTGISHRIDYLALALVFGVVSYCLSAL